MLAMLRGSSNFLCIAVLILGGTQCICKLKTLFTLFTRTINVNVFCAI